MRLIINIPETASANEADLKSLATKTFGRCHVEVDRPEGAVEAIQAADAEQFATQARGYIALARRHQQPLVLVAFRFAVAPDMAVTVGEALRDSVGRQCRAEDLLYCDPQGNLLLLLPQTAEVGATGFCQRIIKMLQSAVHTIGFAQANEMIYCALINFDPERHGAVAALVHDAMTTLEQAVKGRRAGHVMKLAH